MWKCTNLQHCDKERSGVQGKNIAMWKCFNLQHCDTERSGTGNGERINFLNFAKSGSALTFIIVTPSEAERGKGKAKNIAKFKSSS
jgi:hypothetical protein